MSNDRLYGGHTADEVVELMEALALQHEVHSSDEALAIARRGADLLKVQRSKLNRYREALEYIVGSSEPGDEPQPKGMAQTAREALSDE